MTTPRRRDLAATLHQRLLRGLQVGALVPGDRLPGTRDLAREFGADPRVVAAAYRLLAADGLVELRPRSGVYVHPALDVVRNRPRPSSHWVAQIFAQGIARGIRAQALPRVLAATLGIRPVRAVVVATTADQMLGLCRELREDFGLEVRGISADALVPRREAPRAVHRARILLTTEAHASRVAPLATRLGKRFVCVAVRRDLFETEWGLFENQETFVLVADARFGRLVRDYLDRAGTGRRTRVLVAGHDDLSVIPADAPVYATHAARERLGATRLPTGLLPTVRMLADECAADVLRAIIDEVAEAGR